MSGNWFGGGGGTPPPTVAAKDPAPAPSAGTEAVKEAAKREMDKIRKRKGFSSTILTGPASGSRRRELAGLSGETGFTTTLG